MMLSRFRLRRRLNKEGILVENQFVLFVNNVDPIYFNSKKELEEYLSEFRSHTSVFSLQIFKIETYSL